MSHAPFQRPRTCCSHVDLVNLFLQHRAPINTQSKIGQTPLHVCCTTNLGSPEDRLKIATLLLSERKLHLTAVDSTGRDPISCTKNIQLCNLIKRTLQERRPCMAVSWQCISFRICPLSLQRSDSRLGRQGRNMYAVTDGEIECRANHQSDQIC